MIRTLKTREAKRINIDRVRYNRLPELDSCVDSILAETVPRL
ncbi:MAG: hypothetical protein ACK5Q5_10955 [Planctomycetaceae bacterium]